MPRSISKRLLRGRPKKGKKVNLFICGITSYDFSHLGHARTYIVFDMIVKFLRKAGFDVFYLQNVTDIDDKIISRAKREKKNWREIARKFEKEYLKDMGKLKVDSVTKYARASEHIKEIISQVKRLLKAGFAYQIEDGIYFDIKKFKDYGKLSRRTVLEAEDAVSRIDEGKGKRNKGDFCLWKFSKPREPKWQSKFGAGRPGWHIEDTAIAEKYFEEQYDIHGGARDLIFPHHEAEICQMEALSGKKPMVKYWLHTGFLTVNGQKMAKSLGNFITIRDFLKRHSASPHTKDFGVGARILRFFVLKSHWRSPIDYTQSAILQAKKELERIDEFIEKLKSRISTNMTTNNTNKISEIRAQIREYSREFEKAMEDDFNTPKAMAVIFKLINKGNQLLDKEELSKIEARKILKFLKEVDEFFDFIFWKKAKEKIPENILELVKEREKYRKEKNWKAADEIRKKIKKLGYWVEDMKDGSKIKGIK